MKSKNIKIEQEHLVRFFAIMFNIYIYIYMCVRVCVCVYMYAAAKR